MAEHAAQPGYIDEKEKVRNRLRRISGQVGGLERMVEEERYCIDILTQISAVQSALDQVALELLDDHTRHCVVGAKTAEDREELTEEMMAGGRQAAQEPMNAHPMPTEGAALNSVAVSATLHCLTGCAIGEVAGMAIGTALGFSDLGTIALAVALAFLFGYTLTSLPLLRAGLALSAVIPIALAADTLSIALMEIVDNLIMVMIPGAMESGLGDILFWGALSFALAVAGVIAFPLNRWLISRGKGHTAVHETGIHGGPPVRLVGALTVLAFVFGSAVLIAEVADGDSGDHGGDHSARLTVKSASART